MMSVGKRRAAKARRVGPPMPLLLLLLTIVALQSAFAEASRGASAGRRPTAQPPQLQPGATVDDSLDSWLLLADEAAGDGSQRPAAGSSHNAPQPTARSTAASPSTGRDSATTGLSSKGATTRLPITLTLSPNGTINVFEGEGRDIHCRVHNKPPSAQVQWYYIKRRPHGYGFSNYTVIANHYQTINADKFKTSQNTEHGVYTLSVKYFELGDDGQYSCFLYVGFSEAYRESVRVAILPRAPIHPPTTDASALAPSTDLRNLGATSTPSPVATTQEHSTASTAAATAAASSRAASAIAAGRTAVSGSAVSSPPPRGPERRPQPPLLARGGGGGGGAWKEKASSVGGATGGDSRLNRKEPPSSPHTAPSALAPSSAAPPTPGQPAKLVDTLTLDGLEAGGDTEVEEEPEHLLPDVETLPWSRGGGGSAQPTAHAARVSTTRCEYQFVVNEVESGSCPSLSRGGGGDSGGVSHLLTNEIPEDVSSSPYREYGAPSAAATAAAIDAFSDKLEKLEDRLIDEMVKTQIVNHTLSEHAQQLRHTERSTAEHSRNLSALGGAMQRAEAALERQRASHRGLEEKLASVMINVAEMGARLDKAMKKMASIKPEEKAVDVVSAAEAAGCAPLKGVPYFKDCDDAFQKGNKASDVYYVKFIYSACPVPVWCDMDTWPGGWLVIQRRRGGSQKFNLNWADYRKGFGNVSHDFWLGNDNIFLLTNQAEYMLRVDLWDFYDSRVFAEYRRFKVDGERDGYRLHVGNYSGTAKDSLQKHDGVRFSTPDRDHDQWADYHCAMEWEAGWWFTNCWHAFLNGQYSNSTTTKFKGMAWIDWKDEQLARTEMKVRPVAVPQTPPPAAAAAAAAAPAAVAPSDAVTVPV